MNKPIAIIPLLLLVVVQSVLPGAATSPPGKRNVVLITIDTLRADYLSCNGASIVKTPNLDALAAGGVNFPNTRTTVPLTLPAHTSILTALYPYEHGVRDNGTYRLEDNQITLAEVLKKEGYRTAAFVASFVLDHRFGLAQGFDVYEDSTWTNPTMLESFEAERNADAVFRSFAQWLQKENTRPVFVWIHLYDPHAPYNPPQPYAARYPTNRYAGEVAYADSVVGRITEKLRSTAMLNDSIVAIAGDHGEALGEHGEQTHSVLIYNATLHVPMILYAPGLIQPGSRYNSRVRTIDLAPTVLDYLGIRTKIGSGISLREGIETGKEPDLAAPSESLYPKLNLGWSELFGIETGQYHFILAPESELYDLKSDPTEKTNIIRKQPDIANKMAEMLKRFAVQEPASAAAVQADDETKEKLEALGYVSSTRPAGGGRVYDPKTKIEVWNQIQSSVYMISVGNNREASQILEKVFTSEKEIPILYDYLGASYIRMGEWSEAERVYRQAFSHGLESASFHLNLGQALAQRKELSEAEKELKRAIEIDPLNVSGFYHLGNLYRSQRDLIHAEQAYRDALKINPSYVYAKNGLAMTLVGLKRDEEALAEFRVALQLDPGNVASYFNLAVQLERMDRTQEAITTYNKFLGLSNDKEFTEQRKKAAEALTRLRHSGGL